MQKSHVRHLEHDTPSHRLATNREKQIPLIQRHPKTGLPRSAGAADPECVG
jgi:hypothetical protein